MKLHTPLSSSSAGPIRILCCLLSTLALHAQTTLLLHPTELVFSTIQGQPTSTVQLVGVLSTLGTSLSWTVTQKSAWLVTTPSSGTTPSAMTVSVDPTGLGAGTYQGSVQVSTSGATSPQSVQVTLIVNPANRVTLARWRDASQGACSFSVDDSLSAGFETMQQYAVGGTYFLNGTAAPPYFSGFYEAGMELGSHLVNHVCAAMDEATLRANIEPNRDGICASTPQPCDQLISLAWPCGWTSWSEQAWAAEYFLAGRGYNLNQLEDATPSNFMNLKSFNSHEHAPYPPADLKTVLDAAEAQGKWANIVFHALLNDDQAVAYSTTKDLWVATIGEVVKYILQRDRVMLSNYSETSSTLQFKCQRLPLPDSRLRNFEAAFGPEDVVTLQLDITDLPGITAVTVGGNPQPYRVRSRGGRKLLLINVAVGVTAQTVQVSVSSTPVPVLSLNQRLLTFKRTASNNSGAQNLSIAANGTGVLPWRVVLGSSEASWLTVSPETGTGTANVAVSPRAVPLAPGRYVGRIKVLAGPGDLSTSQSQEVHVILLVSPDGMAHYDLGYTSRDSLIQAGWNYLARTPSGAARPTEASGSAAVSYGNVNPGVLRIPVTTGDVAGFANNSQNTLFRDLPVDWTSVRMKIAFMPTQGKNEAGLLVYQDDDNFVNVFRAIVDPGYASGWADHAAGIMRTYYANNVAGLEQEVQQQTRPPQGVAPLPATTCYLRADRTVVPGSEDQIEGFYSLDGWKWLSLGTVRQSIAAPRVGIYVGNPSTVTVAEAANLSFLDVVRTELSPPPPVQTTLTVGSTNPESGVLIAFSASDGSSPGSRATSFAQNFTQGTTVTLTAPGTSTGGTFQFWQKDETNAGSNPTLTVTMDRDHAVRAVYASSNPASANVPEAANYTLVYSLNLPNQANFNSTGVRYDTDRHASVGAFQRIGYYIELQRPGGPVQYLWVSMDAFTSDASKIGIPTLASGASFQRPILNMNVRSTVPGIVTGDGLTGGNLEWWPNNYGPSNAANVPGASSTAYDWGDQINHDGYYGCMQIHDFASSQTLFAYNGWGANGVADLGLGNAPSNAKDWTLAYNASEYTRKLFQVYVLPGTGLATLTVTSVNPNTGVSVSVAPADTQGLGSGTTSLTRSYALGTTVALTAPASHSGVPFQKWLQDGADAGTSPSISVTIDGNHTLTAVYGSPTADAYTLTVNSDNPASGVSVTVNSPDNGGGGTSSTPFARIFPRGTSVTLTAPDVSGANLFQRWLRDGVDAGDNPLITVTMDANHTLTAVYSGPPPEVHTLFVNSASPDVGVTIAVSPLDDRGAGSGTTAFSRHYVGGTPVTLAAPAQVGTSLFQRWLRDGAYAGDNPTLSFVMDDSHTFTAIYAPVPPVQHTLTIQSVNPAAGVLVNIAPLDSSGAGGGATVFSRSYASGTLVTLTAPASSGGNLFRRWLKDGVEAGTGPTLTIAMDASHTVAAVYETPAPTTHTLLVNSMNPSSSVAIGVSPADAAGGSSGLTPLSRVYVPGTSVTLTAPSSTGGNLFRHWLKDGVEIGANPAIAVAMDGSHTLTAVYESGPVGANSIPEALDYVLVYSLHLPTRAAFNSEPITYTLDNRNRLGTFRRIGYYLELKKADGPLQYVWASMDAFTTDASRIGIPTADSGAFFRQSLTNLEVRSNLDILIQGDHLSGGYLEFWSTGYSPDNTADVPGASDTLYDWGDHPDPGDYGSMQIHHFPSRQTVFAYNGWGSGDADSDLGIGNFPGEHTDWTFAHNAASYTRRLLEVYVLPGSPPVPAPQLLIGLADGNIEIMWPTNPAGSVLQTRDLVPNSPWLPFSGPVLAREGWQVAREAPTGQGRLYRVVSP